MSASVSKSSTVSKVRASSGPTKARVNAKPAVPENKIALKKARKVNKQLSSQSRDSKTPVSTSSPSSPTPEQLILVLKSADSPRLYFPKDSIPALPVLVTPSELKKIDFALTKEEIAKHILALRLSQAKKLLSSAFKTRISRLPNEFFLYQRDLVSASVSKYSPAPSAKADIPALPLADAKSVLEYLYKCDSPRFKYETQPAFSVLFPGTSKPEFTMRSGNPSVSKDKFNPLLLSRLRSARLALRKAKINIRALPASFVRDQTRLILASLVIVQKQKAARRKAKAAKAKAKATTKSSAPEFVSSSTPAAATAATPPQPSETPDFSAPKFSTAWYMKVRPVISAYTAIIRASARPSRNSVRVVSPQLDAIALKIINDIGSKFQMYDFASRNPTNYDNFVLSPSSLEKIESVISTQSNLALASSLSDFSNSYE
jgi:hypothetical protein